MPEGNDEAEGGGAGKLTEADAGAAAAAGGGGGSADAEEPGGGGKLDVSRGKLAPGGGGRLATSEGGCALAPVVAAIVLNLLRAFGSAESAGRAFFSFFSFSFARSSAFMELGRSVMRSF